MAKVLDKSRDYGEVMGMPGVRYTQDGAYFKADGSCMVEEEPSRKKQKALLAVASDDDSGFPDPPTAKPMTVDTVDMSVDEQLAAQGLL